VKGSGVPNLVFGGIFTFPLHGTAILLNDASRGRYRMLALSSAATSSVAVSFHDPSWKGFAPVCSL